MAVSDSENLGFDNDENFKLLLINMHSNMHDEGVPGDEEIEDQ